LRYDRRRAELEPLVADKKSDYFGDKKAIEDPDQDRRVGVRGLINLFSKTSSRPTTAATI
jgi:hypothetical protein